MVCLKDKVVKFILFAVPSTLLTLAVSGKVLEECQSPQEIQGAVIRNVENYRSFRGDAAFDIRCSKIYIDGLDGPITYRDLPMEYNKGDVVNVRFREDKTFLFFGNGYYGDGIERIVSEDNDRI